MKMERIGSAVREAPKTLGIKDLLNDKEKSLNFAAIAEEELRNISAITSAAGPVRPDVERQQRLMSLSNKLNLIAQSPDASPTVELSLEEQKELPSLMGKYQRGLDAVKTAEKFVSDEDIETIARVVALHPGESEIAGILALDDSSAKDRVGRALKVYAYKDPGRYAAIVNSLAGARNFAKSDWTALSELFSTAEKYGIDKGTVMQAIDRDDWKELLTSAAAARMQGRDSMLSNLKSGINQIGFQQNLGRISAIVDNYRKHGADRLRYTSEISNALRTVFLQEGVAGSVLTREALQPNAPIETKQAYDGLKNAQTKMEKLMKDTAASDNSLRTLSTDPRWAHRSDPGVSEELAQHWLDDKYHAEMNTQGERGFWNAILRYISSLLGTAYTRSDVNTVASRIRSL
ncbi:MAG TPA: hypothetical protein VMH91_03335 [Candidatus Paceibacterota bacterium]|nr:hypothetical protein [Candidatus Paceibacterota bacterium]